MWPLIPNYLHWLGLIRPLYIFLVKLGPCPNTTTNTAPLSSIMEVVAVIITTLFVVSNSSRNTVTDHTCYIYNTITNFLPKQFIVATIDFSGTIISNFTMMLGGIIRKNMTVSGSDFWYSPTWNTYIVVILDGKPFWNYQSSTWYIIVSGNWMNYSLTSHIWHLNLSRNDIFIGMESVEWCNICLWNLGIHV